MSSFFKQYKCLKEKLCNEKQPLHFFNKHPINLEECFQNFYNLQEVIYGLCLPEELISVKRKGACESEAFRNEGNRLYKEKKLPQALLAYNYALLTAPHKADGEVSGGCEASISAFKESDNNAIAFAYSNRSALLFEMGQYATCLRDINKAMQEGFPLQKLWKLQERKTKCLLKLNRPKEAKSLLNKISTNDKDKLTFIKKLLKQSEETIATCDPIYHIPSIPSPSAYNHVFHTGPHLTPTVTTSPHLACNKEGVDVKIDEPRDVNYLDTKSEMSDAIGVRFSASKGRHLVAKRVVKPGEVLLRESAQCSLVVLDKRIRSVCCVCLRRAPVPLPCNKCSLVVFCSEDCLEKGLQIGGTHIIECQILDLLLQLRLDVDVNLAFKTLSMYDPQVLRKEVNSFSDLSISQNLSVQYNYRSLYFMEGNLQNRTAPQLQEAAAAAVIIVKLLQKINKLEYDAGLASFIGGQAMRLILNFQCNAHCIKELQLQDSVPINSCKSDTIGHGIFSSLSLVNHSCCPNVLHSNLGDTKFIFSISTIRPGEEITDSYGERYVSHDLVTRRNNLQKVYFFNCDCKACKENWALFSQLPLKFSLLCVTCKHPFDGNEGMCKECNTSYRKDKSYKRKHKSSKSSKVPFDSSEVQQSISSSWHDYSITCDHINTFTTTDGDRQTIAHLISLMDSYAALPNKAYIELQESLLRSFDLLGSHYKDVIN